MRAMFGVLSLLIVAALIAFLVKKLLVPPPVKVAPAGSSVSQPAPDQGAPPQQQSQQIQQQVRESLEKSLQQARPMPEDK